jgi:hypothetical protein
MTTFTLESISADPWNAVTLDLPANADHELLQAALEATVQCVDAAHGKMQAVRDGELIPFGWKPGPEAPDAHEFYERAWLDAVGRWEAIKKLTDA